MPVPRPRPFAVAALAAVLALTLAAGTPPAVADDPPMPPMATYVLGLLRKGPAWTPERSARTDSLQAGHMAHMKKMWEARRLLLAGPVSARDDLRGIWVFRADSAAEVRELALGDPTMQTGRLALDLLPWWAPAGIGDGYRERAKNPGLKADSMVTRWLVFLKRGPRWTPRAEEPLRAAHLAHILGRIADGSSPAAGPVDGSDEIAGISIYATDSLSAWTTANADPAVAAGRFRIEMVRLWTAYGNLPGER